MKCNAKNFIIFYLRIKKNVIGVISKDLFDQPGRTAVITGGNRGIGADVVEKLLQCRINVVLGM